MQDEAGADEDKPESSSEFFRRLTPKFLDWAPESDEEKARAVVARREARDAELERITRLAKERDAEKVALRKRGPARPRIKTRTGER